LDARAAATMAANSAGVRHGVSMGGRDGRELHLAESTTNAQLKRGYRAEAVRVRLAQ
jgi:hypothetical protein